VQGKYVYEDQVPETDANANPTTSDPITPPGDTASELGTSPSYTLDTITEGVSSMGIDKGKGRDICMDYALSARNLLTP